MLANFKIFQQASKAIAASMTKAWRAGQKANSSTTPCTTNCRRFPGSYPPSYQSEHPDYMPAAGAAFVASKIDAIAANPDVWAKTAFILNYDENDGIFDHVAPPVPHPARRTNL